MIKIPVHPMKMQMVTTPSRKRFSMSTSSFIRSVVKARFYDFDLVGEAAKILTQPVNKLPISSGRRKRMRLKRSRSHWDYWTIISDSATR